MLLVYYRDKDGAIVRHHQAREGMTRGQLQENIRAYNFEEARKKDGKTAHFEEVEDGTLLAYMVKKNNEQKRAAKCASSYIEWALHYIYVLEERKNIKQRLRDIKPFCRAVGLIEKALGFSRISEG